MLALQQRRELVKQFLEIRDEYKKPTFSLRKKQILESKKTELIRTYYKKTKRNIYCDCDDDSENIQSKKDALKLQKIIEGWIDFTIPMITRVDEFLIFLRKNPTDSLFYESLKEKFSIMVTNAKKSMNTVYQIKFQGDQSVKNEKFTEAVENYYECKLKINEICNNLIFKTIKTK